MKRTLAIVTILFLSLLVTDSAGGTESSYTH